MAVVRGRVQDVSVIDGVAAPASSSSRQRSISREAPNSRAPRQLGRCLVTRFPVSVAASQLKAARLVGMAGSLATCERFRLKAKRQFELSDFDGAIQVPNSLQAKKISRCGPPSLSVHPGWARQLYTEAILEAASVVRPTRDVVRKASLDYSKFDHVDSDEEAVDGASGSIDWHAAVKGTTDDPQDDTYQARADARIALGGPSTSSLRCVGSARVMAAKIRISCAQAEVRRLKEKLPPDAVAVLVLLLQVRRCMRGARGVWEASAVGFAVTDAEPKARTRTTALGRVAPQIPPHLSPQSCACTRPCRGVPCMRRGMVTGDAYALVHAFGLCVLRVPIIRIRVPIIRIRVSGIRARVRLCVREHKLLQQRCEPVGHRERGPARGSGGDGRRNRAACPLRKARVVPW